MEELKIEDKRKNLSIALTETEKLINGFEKVIRQNFDSEPVLHDFSELAVKLIPDEHENKLAETDMRLRMNLPGLCSDCLSCNRCALSKTRKNVVFGEGVTDSPDVMVIGEGPGESEDLQGRPFVGESGQFLDKWLKAISLYRDKNCYITNTVKCRPPMNRDPLPEEKKACHAFLVQQISLIKPRAILCVGKAASTTMTGRENATMGSLRGHFFFYDNRIPMMCTYHPSAVLRDLSLKAAVWGDLQKLAATIGLEINR